jgi:hypothetical protein
VERKRFELLGHGSTAMLHRHYAHLTAKAGVLRNAAALVRPAATPGTLTAGGTAGPVPAGPGLDEVAW